MSVEERQSDNLGLENTFQSDAASECRFRIPRKDQIHSLELLSQREEVKKQGESVQGLERR
ncbi:hypothetical protein FOXG_21367 [Fusarium oxysporum f. sp. lycopersici 4287]|uniref:Uncharacterized protein n=1 Tax=Fusarium oxysporum f. sp. lycopersici (strain 4287 / CBS 123668 / FGSC 9935 / NRRL 34936) TaxID=426428 RepID=A0A0J9VSU3_FUSO4|nr:hypothetical protein FOXG_20940 [Fusarium oxysporum f. sp. lycopersici 4287]XP_018253574.1 hypothetical protein FOXG_21367 [Fusarium oxysporum f. sp. lycopersici 4287]EWZ79174.1 hypothetical protein FOWG_16625 [Fusarium oxysporum f. sp. lycopersici MN25]KNB13831.1 hypothetical protein FOXG_20940 [Fusarium oxysporum f. sp. lycopersici 4287]KNB15529.1 hypothetical protein FOXG_21367 [Fusarium oxysporum f. sp. lycopersici 4287]